MKKICTQAKSFFNKNRKLFQLFPLDSPGYHNGFMSFRQGPQKENAATSAAAFDSLLLAEGLTVGALIHGGIHLVGAHQNLVQGAIVLVAAMMGTLSDGTLDTLVSMAIHRKNLL